MYAGTTDWVQGAMIKDLKGEDQRWKWITWDMDKSFYRFRHFQQKVTNPWEIESIQIVLDEYKSSLRSRIFRRLYEESPEYRQYFISRVDKMFSEQLTVDFFEKKFAEYKELIKDSRHPQEFKRVVELEEFAKRRKQIFCEHVKSLFKETSSQCP